MGDRLDTFINSLPAKLILVFFIIYAVMYFYSNFKDFCAMLNSIFLFFRDRIFRLMRNIERKKYNTVLMQPEYLIWQKKIIDKIYEPLLKECAHNKNCEIHMTKLTITGENGYKQESISHEYESYTMPLKSEDCIPFPFYELCNKSDLQDFMDDTKFKKDDDYLPKSCKLSFNDKKVIKRYYRIVMPNIHFPNRIGYMLDDISFDEKEGKRKIRIVAHPGVYMQNVLQSHVLEYELYLFYKKYFMRHLGLKKSRFDIDNLQDRADILKFLPLRKNIHDSFLKDREWEILLRGCGRESLLSVQIFVLIRNHSGGYDCLRIRRSNNVAAKAGYIQFIPSGGFEAFNGDTSREAQWTNFSLNKVLFREMAEECFGLPDDIRNDKISPESIYLHKDIKQIITNLKTDEEARKKVEYEFIGITESLVGLRPELSFIMKIDDDSIIQDIIGNEESSHSINFIDIREMEKPEFWVYNKKNSNPNEEKATDLMKLNCTSAGLFELARNSRIYQSCLE